MAKDPWKRAHDINRLKQRSVKTHHHEIPEAHAANPRRLSCGCVLALILFVMIVVGAAVLYFTRVSWLPQYRDKLPEPVVQVVEQVVPVEQAVPDLHLLSAGLDASLRQFDDYGLFVGAMHEKDIVLKVIATGGNTWRLSYDGMLVYVQDGLIWTYELDLGVIFSDERYRMWWSALRDAGLSPELSWIALTGESEMPTGHTEISFASNRMVQVQGSVVYGVYTLHFSNGYLSRVEAGVGFNEGIHSGSPPNG